MSNSDIPRERLVRQRVAGASFETAPEVVRWLGAVQAQDFAGAKWALGLRTSACSDAQVEQAFSAGEILRVHVMRPTWHFIPAEDILWMHKLTAGRVKAAMAYQYRRLELNTALFRHSNRVLHRALRGRQLTRAELASALQAEGIMANGLRLIHILANAEADAIICSGPRRGKQFTYALVEERVPRPKDLDHEQALALLSERYFLSHGPATVRDYAWWSGLSVSEATVGLEMVKRRLAQEQLGKLTYWFDPARPMANGRAKGSMRLLPNYDEYVVGYTDRNAVFDSSHSARLDSRHNPIFNHTILSDGQVIGTWTPTIGKAAAIVEAMPFRPLTPLEGRKLKTTVDRYGAFLGLPASLISGG